MRDRFEEKARSFEVKVSELNMKYKNELNGDILSYFNIHHCHTPEKCAYLEFMRDKHLSPSVLDEVNKIFNDFFHDF